MKRRLSGFLRGWVGRAALWLGMAPRGMVWCGVA